MTIKTHERFGQVRTVEQDGSTWYVGRDVAKILGYAKPEGFIARHVAKDDKKRLPVRSLNSPHTPPTVIINSRGLTDLCKAASSDFAADLLRWLLDDVKIEEKAALPSIITVAGVRGYADLKGVAWLNAEDIARECGWVEYRHSPESGEAIPYIRWRRINGYLKELGFSTECGEGSFLPENIFYRLIWKSRSDYAEKFQALIADVILPAIRRKGSYVKGEMSLFPDEEPIKEKKAIRRPLPEYAIVYIILFSNGLVKIGYTSDFNRRLKELRKETKLEVVEIFTTGMMPLDEAQKFERTLKAKFFAYVVSGEFFNIDFETAKDALTGNVNPKVDKLLAIADRMDACAEKNSLLLQAAALIGTGN